MDPVSIGIATFAAVFGGALIGMAVARSLPDHHLESESRNAVGLATAVVSTLSALVLSLLLTQAATNYRARADAVVSLAASIERLDRTLSQLGPTAGPVRATLRAYAATKLDEVSSGTVSSQSSASLELLDRLSSSVRGLAPGNSEGQFLHAQAVGITVAIADERWLLAEKNAESMPASFLVLIIFWLTLIFISFGLFSPGNPTVVMALLCCALAVAGGVYMTVELGSPAKGLITTPTDALAVAVAEISRKGE